MTFVQKNNWFWQQDLNSCADLGFHLRVFCCHYPSRRLAYLDKYLNLLLLLAIWSVSPNVIFEQMKCCIWSRLIISTQQIPTITLATHSKPRHTHMHRHRKTHRAHFHNFLSNQEIQGKGHILL